MKFLKPLAAIFGLALILSACAVFKADTVGQRAYALYGSFVVIEETAADAMTIPDLPVPIKTAIRDADAKAYPLAEALRIAAQNYTAAVAAAKEDSSASADQLAALALKSLEKAFNEARPAIQEFLIAVNAVKPVPTQLPEPSEVTQ